VLGASIEGMDSNPVYMGETCFGKDFREPGAEEHRFSLEPLLDFYRKSGESDEFFSRLQWFHLLTGDDQVLLQIKEGVSEPDIRASWAEELAEYRSLRAKYLLYP
jgi:hypothetical protein